MRLTVLWCNDGAYAPAMFFAVCVAMCFVVFAATEMTGERRHDEEVNALALYDFPTNGLPQW